MSIHLENIGKKFNKEWIFRNVNTTFHLNETYAITGSNGSGKSTLLQIILGFIEPTEGHIKLDFKSNLSTSNQFSNFSIAAPYIELIEEMTALEFLTFHLKFKNIINNFSCEDVLQKVQLYKAKDKQIRFFSSGMKQRLKLAQAFFSDTTVLLLDEPCSNLDKQGIDLYQQLIKDYTSNRIVIICSNDEQEYSFCSKILNLNNITAA
jgi:ABC-type multidrug transport system ATPase subunit